MLNINGWNNKLIRVFRKERGLDIYGMMNLSIKCKNRREIQSGQEQSRDIEIFFGGVYVYIYT